jgi:hypothetical protein
MKTTLEKVYQCDHCGKKTRSASTTSRHEKYCSQNPHNRHICFEYCEHLQKDVHNTYDEEGNLWYWRTDMYCKAKDIKMYSYKIEKRIGFDPKWVSGLVRMPLDCDKFKSMSYHEIDKLHR